MLVRDGLNETAAAMARSENMQREPEPAGRAQVAKGLVKSSGSRTNMLPQAVGAREFSVNNLLRLLQP
jgi:hypothetical protein